MPDLDLLERHEPQCLALTDSGPWIRVWESGSEMKTNAVAKVQYLKHGRTIASSTGLSCQRRRAHQSNHVLANVTNYSRHKRHDGH